MTTFPTSKRTIIDYTSIDPFFNFKLGKVCHLTARPPLEEHIHPEAIELSYFTKGEQVYTIEDISYTINSGEMFITLPNEYHSSGSHPKDKSHFYYLIISTQLLQSLLFSEEESQQLLKSLLTISKRVFKVSPRLTELFESLLECGQDPKPFHKTRIRNLLSELLMTVIEDEKSQLPPTENPMEEVLTYIKTHIYDELPLTHLAHMTQLSEGRFKTNFRLYTGLPPREYILRQKIKYAKQLLKEESLSITQISYQLGFSSSQYFSTVFKRFTTLSPIDYRNQELHNL